MTNNPKQSIQGGQAPEGHDDRPAPLDCRACEALVTDMLDEQLSPADHAAFDRHITSCESCTEFFAQARQGAALLTMLKTPRPQPRPKLLETILALTSGSEISRIHTANSPFAETVPHAAAVAGSQLFGSRTNSLTDRPGVHAGRLLSFRPRASAPRRFGQLLLEPRLAMTAAMAFCSITLTMSLTGVRLNDLHRDDLSLNHLALNDLRLNDLHLNDLHLNSLSPSGVRRSVHTAEAGVVRYYDNLRVVHVLESRVENLRESLQSTRDNEAPAPAPASSGPARRRPEAGSRHRPLAPDAGTSQLTPQPSSPTPRHPAPPVGTMLAALLTPSNPNGDRP